jgi:hypothetical protein
MKTDVINYASDGDEFFQNRLLKKQITKQTKVATLYLSPNITNLPSKQHQRKLLLYFLDKQDKPIPIVCIVVIFIYVYIVIDPVLEQPSSGFPQVYSAETQP